MMMRRRLYGGNWLGADDRETNWEGVGEGKEERKKTVLGVSGRTSRREGSKGDVG